MFSSLLISYYFFYYLNYFKIPKIWYVDELCIAQKFNCYIYISANLAHPLKMVMHRQAMHNVFSVRKPKYGQLFNWTFLSKTNSLAKIHEISSQKYAPETEKFHLRGSAAQTMGSIEKLDIPFCSLQSTEQIICPSQLCGMNIFWAT